MNNLLEVRGLCKTYGSGTNKLEVLSGIDLDLQGATTTALIGASGAGKSTLLHLLGALDRPTSGTVCFAAKIFLLKMIGNWRRSGIVVSVLYFSFITFFLNLPRLKTS